MLGKSRAGLAVASMLAAVQQSFSFAGSSGAGLPMSDRRRNGSHKRSQKRSALRHGRGDGYEMVDGILHKQSDNWRMPNLRGYPGAKMARKAAQGKIGKRA